MVKQTKKEELSIAESKKKIKVTHKFVTVLSIVSIIGFFGIISHSLFNYNLYPYVEAMWMFVVGIGLILESRFKWIKSLPEKGLTSNNFTHLTTMVIGSIALVAGIFSFPEVRIDNPAFIAIKGILAIIAIIVIVIQTWIIE